MNSEPKQKNWTDYSPKFNTAFRDAVILQIVLLILTALMLDGGNLYKLYKASIVCYCVMSGMILLFRPMNPTKLDIELIRFGIIPVFISMVFAQNWMHH